LDEAIEIQSEMLVNKIKHYLITTMGVTVNEASGEEFYRAFSLTIREELMINWTATQHSYRNKHVRTLYYICMEFMPGRFLGNNITNIKATKLVQKVMQKMNRKIADETLYEPDPGLGNGGLGRLASCLLDSLSTQQYPAIGYGLRYQYGIFDQEIWNGRQVERPDTWLLHENPWEFRRDIHAASVYYSGQLVAGKNKRGEAIYELIDYDEVRALAYDIPIIGYEESTHFNVNTLRLWTTKESPRNFQLQRFNAGQLDKAGENTSLTDVLYPNDNNELGKRIRLKQEFLLSSASVQDIFAHYLRHNPDMSYFADKVRIQINDTHPALVITELMRILLNSHDFLWAEAWDIVRTCCSFTNHTVLKESLEEWNQNRVKELLPGQYAMIERMNLELCNSIRTRYPGDEEKVRRMSIIEGGQLRMAHLAIYGAYRVNGVAALHTDILKNIMFRDFHAMYPEKFINITNGVTQRRWLLHSNPSLAEFITKRIGPNWIVDFSDIHRLAAFASDAQSQQEFLDIKRGNKKRLIDFLKESNPIRDDKGRILGFTDPLNEQALFDVHIKRIHEYKRQLMNGLHALMLYFEIKANPGARKIKRQILFAGKAAPGYEIAKNIVRFIYCIARKINTDPDVSDHLRVIFIENYNVSKAELIIPAADLSEQISTAGMEASGTGNMKLTMNGALTIGTEDGANVEMHQQVTDKWWPFGFGRSSRENHNVWESGKTYNPWDIYLNHPGIHQAVDALRDQSLASTEDEHVALSSLYHVLLETKYSNIADRYFVLSDLLTYYDTQKKVEDWYVQPNLWAEYAIHNIAAMGSFSTDRSIHDYASQVWGLDRCPVSTVELDLVRKDYSDHDKCRIF